ncbi:MAG: GGDEF domain-containing protein [Eubacterium sp.]|nr:GGDEF domain-containing protein [Eubacterium sp.]
MKKIALVIESWKRYITSAWVLGMNSRIKELGQDISVYMFNASANWSNDARYNKGEHNIFNLPDFKDFDGVVVEINNNNDLEVKEKLLNRVRESEVPAIYINNEAEGFISVGVDNYGSMYRCIDHLYSIHKCRNFAFVMGPDSNYENKKRLAALVDFSTKHNMVKDRDYHIFYNGFDLVSGSDAFDKVFNKIGFIPQAVICANDNLAVGFITEAEKRGFNCPEDFLITGFDDLDKARYFDPRISTVSYTRESIGAKCIDVLKTIWDGEDALKDYTVETRNIFWESCGCHREETIDAKEQMKNYIIYNEERERFENDVLKLSTRLTHCDSFGEMLSIIPESLRGFRCNDLYLVFDKNYIKTVEINKNISKNQYYKSYFNGDNNIHDQLFLDENIFLTEGYPEEMEVAFAFDGKKDLLKDTIYEDVVSLSSNNKKNNSKSVNSRIKYQKKNIRGLFPYFKKADSGDVFIFLPIHFLDKNVGYMVMRNAMLLMNEQFVFEVMNAMITGLEQLFYKERMERLNRVLIAAYNHDSMTGLYNRLGLSQYGGSLLDKCHKEGCPLAVTFIDMDHLKIINDNYGHKAGDNALKAIAEEIQNIISVEGLGFRLGGDEFLLLERFDSEDRCQKVISDIRENLLIETERNHHPIKLSISAGFVVTDPASDVKLEDYINQADNLMYLDKKERNNIR